MNVTTAKKNQKKKHSIIRQIVKVKIVTGLPSLNIKILISRNQKTASNKT